MRCSREIRCTGRYSCNRPFLTSCPVLCGRHLTGRPSL
nr:MAG TPA: hypothetical protein [Caudoviricetes sp.]